MSWQEIIEKIKPELENREELFREEIRKIRAGRLSFSLIEDIKADCFGQEMPLKQLGAISSSSLKELSLQLWDKSYVEGVVKAIEKENLGLSLRIDGSTIYFSAPPLTEETRENLFKILADKKEKAFQDIRRLRDRAWKEIQEGFQKGEVREDDKYKGKDKLEDVVRQYREKIEEMIENKEKEIKG